MYIYRHLGYIMMCLTQKLSTFLKYSKSILLLVPGFFLSTSSFICILQINGSHTMKVDVSLFLDAMLSNALDIYKSLGRAFHFLLQDRWNNQVTP
jgi:hypothetical protein